MKKTPITGPLTEVERQTAEAAAKTLVPHCSECGARYERTSVTFSACPNGLDHTKLGPSHDVPPGPVAVKARDSCGSIAAIWLLVAGPESVREAVARPSYVEIGETEVGYVPKECPGGGFRAKRFVVSLTELRMYAR